MLRTDRICSHYVLTSVWGQLDTHLHGSSGALRAVTSTDGVITDYYDFSHAFLGATATRIINEVKGINRVVYDITSKPPGTIEWE